MHTFRVGIDSYSLCPLDLSPFEVMDWVKQHGGAGVQFSHVHLKEGQTLDQGLLKDIARHAKDLDLYLEWGEGQHIPLDMTDWKPKDLGPINQKAVQHAHAVGASVIRSCSGGLMRWNNEAPPTETLLRETAKALRSLKPLLMDHNVVLALETHFEFTTFELLKVFEMCDAEPGGCLGICLDTMNLFTLLEDPVAGTQRVLPWVVATHLKDGGLIINDEGLVSFTAGIGEGVVDLKTILSMLATLDRTVHLSIEDHGGSFPIPIFDPFFLSRFPDLTVWEMSRLMRSAQKSLKRIQSQTLFILNREDWPGQCESRVAQDIKTLKKLVKGGAQPS